MLRRIISYYVKDLIDAHNRDTVDISNLKRRVYRLEEDKKWNDMIEWARQESKDYEEYELVEKLSCGKAIFNMIHPAYYEQRTESLEKKEFFLLKTYNKDTQWELWVKSKDKSNKK